MERRRGGNGLWMPAVLVKAGKSKGGENTSWRREGWDSRPCTTLMEDGVWGGQGRGGEERGRGRGQSWKCILSGEGHEWNGRWKRRAGRGGRTGGKEGRMEGSRGVSEERGRAGWGLWLPLLTAIDFL